MALTGTTVTVLWVTQIDDVRRGLEGRYATARDRLERTLESLGVTPTRDEPPNSFCPGQHGLSAEGKLVGLAQRVRADVAVVAGLIVIDDHDAIATVLADVYDALDVPFDPASVGSLERAGGEADPDAVIATVERAFLEETAATRVEAATLRSDDETATSSRTL